MFSAWATRVRPFLKIALLLLGPLSLGLAFLYAPPALDELGQDMGPSQRIFYYHVPSAMMAFFAFFLVLVGSSLFLITRQKAWDLLAGASAEVGLLFCSIVLTTGPLWAKPAWGVYWTWDVRLTTTLLMAIMYVAYLMLRDASRDNPRKATMTSVYGIICFVNVPIVHLSVRLFKSVHPLLFKADSSIGRALAPEMWTVLAVCMLTISCLFGWMLLERLALAEAEDGLEELRELSRVKIEIQKPGAPQ